jgi:hypothetical protein
MKNVGLPNMWKAVLKGDSWLITDAKGKTIATITNNGKASTYAKIIAASPYMLEALKAISALIGDEDLPDNGELSGAAISDMVRTAISLSE